MSGLIEARIYHLPKEAQEAAINCSGQLDSRLICQPLTEFLSACAQTNPVLGVALEICHPVRNVSRLGIYVILPPVTNEPSVIDMVSEFHGVLARQIKLLGVPVVSHSSFVYASLGSVEEKLAHLKTVVRTSYCLGFIPMVADR